MKKTVMLTVAVAGLAFASDGARGEPGRGRRQGGHPEDARVRPAVLPKFPEGALPGAWEEMKTLQLNPGTVLNGRTKELIGLGVAAQIPCRYCIVAHTEFAKLNGASEAEVGEAVAMAALTRHWSTFLNGIQTDETKFRGEIAKIIENVKKASASKAPAGTAGRTWWTATARSRKRRRCSAATSPSSSASSRARRGPAPGGRSATCSCSPTTALNGKQKELVGLAVAAQVPCRFCVIAHTEFAKLNGATDAEIKEALGMASLTRELSTMLNGMQVDEAQFRKDVDRLVKGAKAAAKKNPATAQR